MRQIDRTLQEYTTTLPPAEVIGLLTRAASSIKDKEGLSYTEWAKRLQRYYETLEALLWPDLIVVGGGVSKNADKFIPKLKLKTEMVPAQLRNSAGIVGAAWLAADRRVNPDPMM